MEVLLDEEWPVDQVLDGPRRLMRAPQGVADCLVYEGELKGERHLVGVGAALGHLGPTWPIGVPESEIHFTSGLSM